MILVNMKPKNIGWPSNQRQRLPRVLLSMLCVLASVWFMPGYAHAEEESHAGAQKNAQKAQKAEMKASLEKELDDARRALDEAAMRVAELHEKQHAVQKGQKHAMLGVLLGPGPMIGGVDLVGTTPKSGAAEVGLTAGDKLLHIGDVSLSVANDPMGALSKYMKTVKPGEVVTVVYERDGQQQSVDIETHARSAHIMKLLDDTLDEIKLGLAADLNKIDLSALQALDDLDLDLKDLEGTVERLSSGLVIECDDPQLLEVKGELAAYFGIKSGVVVTRPLAESNLLGGDVLLTVGGETVTALAQAQQLLAGAELGTPAIVQRNGKQREVALRAGELGDVPGNVKVIRIRD